MTARPDRMAGIGIGFIEPAALLDVFFEFNGEAISPVQVAQEQYRYIPPHGVLHLDHLILLGGGVGAVSDQEILGDLLFDSYPGGGILLGGGSGQEWIHPKIADPE